MNKHKVPPVTLTTKQASEDLAADLRSAQQIQGPGRRDTRTAHTPPTPALLRSSRGCCGGAARHAGQVTFTGTVHPHRRHASGLLRASPSHAAVLHEFFKTLSEAKQQTRDGEAGRFKHTPKFCRRGPRPIPPQPPAGHA